MLVKFTETNGKDIWLNPLHVKGLRPKNERTTLIFIGFNPNWGQVSVKVSMSMDEVALALNNAMPEILAPLVEDDATMNPAMYAG